MMTVSLELSAFIIRRLLILFTQAHQYPTLTDVMHSGPSPHAIWHLRLPVEAITHPIHSARRILS
jgi:hypothetical protein